MHVIIVDMIATITFLANSSLSIFIVSFVSCQPLFLAIFRKAQLSYLFLLSTFPSFFRFLRLSVVVVAPPLLRWAVHLVTQQISMYRRQRNVPYCPCHNLLIFMLISFGAGTIPPK